jgi:hypothetical protein
MLTPTVTALGTLPSAHPLLSGRHTASPLVMVVAERVVRPRPDRKAPA